jgi:hypothetical protein
MGRRRLLFISVFGALASLSLVGIGLNTGMVVLSSVAIITFVMYVVLPLVIPSTEVSSGHLLWVSAPFRSL